MTTVIDVHAHFHTPYTNRGDWQRYNASRLDAGDRIGVVCHVASVLGSWGATSPTYFASPDDQTRANDWMLDFADEQAPRVKAWVAVNPNYTAHALAEIERGIARGAIGIKLAAGRRADDALLDDIAAAAEDDEPPPPAHPVWRHKRIIMTPHNAAFDTKRERSRYVAQAILAHERGEPLPNLFQPARGY